MQAVGTATMAEQLDISPEKLREMVHAGEVPFIKVGRILKFDPESVFHALEQRKSRTIFPRRPVRSVRARRKVF